MTASSNFHFCARCSGGAGQYAPGQYAGGAPQYGTGPGPGQVQRTSTVTTAAPSPRSAFRMPYGQGTEEAGGHDSGDDEPQVRDRAAKRQQQQMAASAARNGNRVTRRNSHLKYTAMGWQQGGRPRRARARTATRQGRYDDAESGSGLSGEDNPSEDEEEEEEDFGEGMANRIVLSCSKEW